MSDLIYENKFDLSNDEGIRQACDEIEKEEVLIALIIFHNKFIAAYYFKTSFNVWLSFFTPLEPNEICNLNKEMSGNECAIILFSFCYQEEVNAALEALLLRQAHLGGKLKSISQALPNLQNLKNDAVRLSEMISFTSDLAENVSAKVRQLDEARVCVLNCTI